MIWNRIRRSSLLEGAEAREKGPTLIELMVGVVLIGILAAIAIPNFMSLRIRVREDAVLHNMHTCRLALENSAIMADGYYPRTIGSTVRLALVNLGHPSCDNDYSLIKQNGTTAGPGDIQPLLGVLADRRYLCKPFNRNQSSIETVHKNPKPGIPGRVVHTPIRVPPRNNAADSCEVRGEGSKGFLSFVLSTMC